MATASLYAQEEEAEPAPLVEKPPIELYKRISIDRDTTFLDTTLSVQKMYRFNYHRKDNFEKLYFANVGQTQNSLGYEFISTDLKPRFVALGQQFSYKEAKDVAYYHVPTPLTDLYFKTAFNQGQQLDAFLTINTSEQFNMSLSYKGVRSLGHYVNALTSTGNFEFTTNYKTENDKYHLRAHYTAQGLTNEQNGGLRESSIPLFVENESRFRDRARLDTKFEDAENALYGNRIFIDQNYNLLQSEAETDIRLGAVFQHEKKKYHYRQKSAYNGFGSAYRLSDLDKTTELIETQTKAYAELNNVDWGNLEAHINYLNYNYGYNTVLVLDEGTIHNRIKGNAVEVGGRYRNTYKKFKLDAGAGGQIGGDLDGTYAYGKLQIPLLDDVAAEVQAHLQSHTPDYGFMLYQSDYVNYNWQNNFKNIRKQQLRFDLLSDKWFNAQVAYTGMDNFTYFALDEHLETPKAYQYDKRVDYLKVRVQKEQHFGKFGIEAQVQYQEVMSGDEVLSVPKLLTRATLFYQDHWFNRAMFMQTGISATHFTKYYMNAYDPVIGDFYVQKEEKYGDFPMLNLFFNAKVRQTRIYLSYDYLNELFTSKSKHFSAPDYPYRDAVIRFGLVWNFFQ